MSLEVERLAKPQQLLDLGPALVELQNTQLTSAPHYRPVTFDELQLHVQADTRFTERAILIAREGGQLVGWCHLEPPGVARTAGDLYPYVGGLAAFQPGVPFAQAGSEEAEILQSLLYAACQIRAQQDCRVVEVFAHESFEPTAPLRAIGFQPADTWATYVAPLSGGPVGHSPLTVSPLREAELSEFASTLQELDLLGGRFTADDLSELIASFPDFTTDGLLIARRAGEVVGYAVVVVDAVYVSATGRKRAWLGLGPLGMGVQRGTDQRSWLRTLVNAASIAALAKGATELAFVAKAGKRERMFWITLQFEVEVHWRRWRVEL